MYVCIYLSLSLSRFGEDSVWDAPQLKSLLKQRTGVASFEKIQTDIDSLMSVCILAGV